MEKETKSPINLMADLLAAMTARAMEAERERDEAKKRADDWYMSWQRKDEQLREKEAKLADASEQITELRVKLADMAEEYYGLQTRIGDYIAENTKGEQDNG